MKVDTETFAGNQIPILLIGNKMDCAEMFCGKNMSRRSAVAEECGADELKLVGGQDACSTRGLPLHEMAGGADHYVRCLVGVKRS